MSTRLPTKYVPGWAKSILRFRVASRDQRRFSDRTLAATFEEIYQRNSWGNGSDQLTNFSSGPGSVGVAAERYVAAVRDYMESNDLSSILDVGCGDYAIGRRLAEFSNGYVGVDVVAPLIDRLKAFEKPGVAFHVLDVTQVRPSSADVILIRQVLQHLSNNEIGRLLALLPRDIPILVTESAPLKKTGAPNLDIVHGPHTRLPFRSWVDLEAPPFSVANVEPLLSVRTASEELRTVHFTLPPHARRH